MTDMPSPAPADQPLVADKPSFTRDLKNGLKNVLKTVWRVPAAQGYIATLIVRLLVTVGLPAGLGSVVIAVLESVAK